MIYDSIEYLGYYRFISPTLASVEEAIADGGVADHIYTRKEGGATVTPFDGTMVFHNEQLCLHWVKEGEEVIAVGYSEQAVGSARADESTHKVEGAQVATVITLKADDFVILMPKEPYRLALPGTSEDYRSESIRFV